MDETTAGVIIFALLVALLAYMAHLGSNGGSKGVERVNGSTAKLLRALGALFGGSRRSGEDEPPAPTELLSARQPAPESPPVGLPRAAIDSAESTERPPAL